METKPRSCLSEALRVKGSCPPVARRPLASSPAPGSDTSVSSGCSELASSGPARKLQRLGRPDVSPLETSGSLSHGSGSFKTSVGLEIAAIFSNQGTSAACGNSWFGCSPPSRPGVNPVVRDVQFGRCNMSERRSSFSEDSGAYFSPMSTLTRA
ncbi:hypothetical protein WJX84_000083 [Apatococcus fuscideae]|uniref:Uncharacterized protein n=1 Tax=Apatococcus fuscideae TaxID=2026836 RepID=A0AAW1T433_9CHLO